MSLSEYVLEYGLQVEYTPNAAAKRVDGKRTTL